MALENLERQQQPLPGTRLPENTLARAGTKAAFRLGRSLPKKSPKAVDVGKFQGVTNAVQSPQTQSPTGRFSETLKSLGPVTTPYNSSTRFEKVHPGVDIGAKIGTQLPSLSGGTVTDVRRGQTKGSPDFGNYVIIKDPQGRTFRYSHLNQDFVKIGDKIQPGQTIGEIGNTGQVYSLHGGTGSHLDLRIRDAFGKYVNPFAIN